MIHKIFIGLETHLQLKTKSKMFCSCEVSFLEKPNSRTCPVCLGMPGSLPKLNQRAVELALRACLLLNAKTNMQSKFDRKNYFYPDLPKNYQISQYDIPLGFEGYLTIKSKEGEKNIPIQRIHMEEDAGKLIHPENENKTFVDLNRSGAPLVEIVTHPAIHSIDDAVEYMKTLRLMMRSCGISDCNMEKGELRCDVNISVSRDGKLPDYKSEIKNMNSFKFMKQALTYEIDRQIKSIKNSEVPEKKTYGFDVAKGQTFEMRSKEEAMDYRYFPDPDLPPLLISNELIEKVKNELPETPQQKIKRLEKEYSLNHCQATILVEYESLADDFEYCAKKYNPQYICNWLINDAIMIINDQKLNLESFTKIKDDFTELVKLFYEKKLTNIMAKDFLSRMLIKQERLQSLMKGIKNESFDLTKVIEEVVKENKKAIDDFKAGKESSSKFLLGQVMKKTKGQIAPQEANKALTEFLSKL